MAEQEKEQRREQSARSKPIAARPQALNTATNTAGSSLSSAGSTPRKELTPTSSVSKRSSFAENLNLRNYPTSPRSHRTNSFSGAALTELLMHPTSRPTAEESRFQGRDWRHIHLAEIIDPDETRFVELDTSVEDTIKLLVRSGAPNLVLVRESRKTRTAIATWDYSDLNAYLLLVLGLAEPDEQAAEIADRARRGETIPLGAVTDHLGPRVPPAFLPQSATLAQAMEVLGGGHHRLVVTKEGSTEAMGVLSQLRLVRFFWENHQNFAATEQLYGMMLKDLSMGAKEVVAVNGDKPLADALRHMHNEGVTSLPVLDTQHNVVGNISHVDTKLLTDTSAIPLLSATCIHFISVILSERGMLDGQDSYPVFYVTPYSTLAHTVAKLCATRSHRMWIVDAPSPSSSIPPSPGPHAPPQPFGTQNPGIPGNAIHHSTPASLPSRSVPTSNNMEATPTPPYTSTHPSISTPAAQLPGAGMSGRLSGVVSLTDVLNVLARASGLKPGDPEETRRKRRQSSGSNTTRGSVDGARPSGEVLRGAGAAGLGRSGSSASERRRGGEVR